MTKDGIVPLMKFASENISVNASGGVHDSEGNYLDQIALVTFPDLSQLDKGESGVYFTGGGQPIPANGAILQGYLEESNVDELKEMVSMLESQRHLQSAAQVLKMYDKMIDRAVTEIGRIQ